MTRSCSCLPHQTSAASGDVNGLTFTSPMRERMWAYAFWFVSLDVDDRDYHLDPLDFDANLTVDIRDGPARLSGRQGGIGGRHYSSTATLTLGGRATQEVFLRQNGTLAKPCFISVPPALLTASRTPRLSTLPHLLGTFTWSAPLHQPQSVFRSSEFRRYYAGQALSYLGDGLRTLVIPLLVFPLDRLGGLAGTHLRVRVTAVRPVQLARRVTRRPARPSQADARRRCRAVLHHDGSSRFALWRGVLSLPLLYVGRGACSRFAPRSFSARRPRASPTCSARIGPRPPSPPWSRPSKA